MSNKYEEYKKEHCSNCNKNIDCKIILDINNNPKCTEE